MLSTKSLLLATCLAAAPGLALAQSSTTQAPSSAQSPGMTQSAPAGSGSSMGAGSNMNESSATKPGSSTMSQTERSGTMGAGASSASMQPLSQPSANQIMISDLRGTTVYSSNNENVGDIKDIVITRDGKLEAMIVGVGGFLGI
ncbi:MAG TPA: PRC-barrel domain-containing protein, partial [Beijerinckiaceae bacterium]